MSLSRRTFLKAFTAVGAMLGLVPAGTRKVEVQEHSSYVTFPPGLDIWEEEPSRITFPPGTLVELDTYTLPTGEVCPRPGEALGCWARVDFHATLDGHDVTPLWSAKVFTGRNGYVEYFPTEGNPKRVKLSIKEDAAVRLTRFGNVTFSYQPPEEGATSER